MHWFWFFFIVSGQLFYFGSWSFFIFGIFGVALILNASTFVGADEVVCHCG